MFVWGPGPLVARDPERPAFCRPEASNFKCSESRFVLSLSAESQFTHHRPYPAIAAWFFFSPLADVETEVGHDHGGRVQSDSQLLGCDLVLPIDEHGQCRLCKPAGVEDAGEGCSVLDVDR